MLIAYFQIIINKKSNKKLSASWRMKNTKKKLNGQSKVVKASFTGNNITRYSGLNTVAKYIHLVKLVSDLAKLFNGVNRQSIVETGQGNKRGSRVIPLQGYF